jgi:hypothetical protein
MQNIKQLPHASGIYLVENLAHKNIPYIGQAKDIYKRFNSHHIYDYVNPENCCYNTKFYQALRKYGIENFKVTILDVSPFNRKEVGDQYLKAAQFGLPTVSMYAASQGLNQAELDSMNLLENDVLEIKKLFIPLSSSNTQSGNPNTKIESKGATDNGGAPKKDAEDLTESGEQNQEDA